MEGAGKVILDANKGPGACHPTQCLAMQDAEMETGPSGPWSRCTDTRESFGRRLRRLQGLEQRRSVSMSMSMVSVDSTGREAQGRRETEAVRL